MQTMNGEMMVEGQGNPVSAAEGVAVFELREVAVALPSGGEQRQILAGIDLDVRAGEIVGIVGPSGTGKTTLLRVLSGLIIPTAGTVLLDRKPVSGPTAEAVTVFQDYSSALLPWRTVARNVALPLEGRVSKSERTERVMRALGTVGLADRANEYPWRLSGGMQQRVQIARALVLEPRVLLMDEPFGALDAITKASLHDQLLEVHAKTGATIIFITHDVEEAVYLSDRVMVIHDSPGRIVHEVTCELVRPRDQIGTRDDPRYHEIRQELARVLQHGHAA
ncbi:MAG TPA: ABC transporter ATP-binding protein [Solirubrobacteraceae bacterium]|jgi:NitT/TauT family transport system ATP-binding protein|nr:ABC transporter ATP-binding protein [Solirubrobacteraceae bacterium]